MRVQLIVLGSTGVLALGMAAVMAIHEPFVAKPEQVVEQPPPEDGDEGLIRVDAKPRGRGPVTQAAISRANLRSLLSKLARTHNPARRKRLIERARERMLEFEPYIAEILPVESNELIMPAIDLVGELQMASAVPYLEFLSHGITVAVRAAAIRACTRIRPWGAEELRGFLDQEPDRQDPLVLEAALEACTQIDDRPVAEVIPLLGHEDHRVRAAAVAAIPRLAAGEDMTALCKFARGAEGLQAEAAAQALGRTQLPEDAERCLTELLSSDNWLVVDAALAALANKESPLGDVEPLLAILRDSERSVRERLFGFIAMESTGTVPVETVGEMLPTLHPILQLLGARCLVTVGNRSGLDKIIELLDSERSDTFDEDQRSYVVSGALAVLTELAGEDLGESSAAWRRWYGQLEQLKPVQLQTPAPTFW